MQAAAIVLVVLASVAMPARSACELEPERPIAGAPLSFWVAELGSYDRARTETAREALRSNPVDALAAILAAKVNADRSTVSRHLHSDIKGLFEGAGSATPSLAPYLGCDRPRVREMAVQLLGWIGPVAAEAHPAVVAALSDPDEGVRMQAGFTVARIGVVDASVLAALRSTLDDENWRASNAAASALAAFWPRSRATFVKALVGEPERERFWAMRGLRRIDGLDPEIVALLVQRAENDTPNNRNEALDRLRELDPSLVAAHLKRFEPFLQDDAVRCRAARLLVGRSAPELDAVLAATMIDLMQQPQTPQRNECRENVHRDLPRVISTVDVLVPLLHHPRKHVRIDALNALSRIDPRPAETYDLFLSVLDDSTLRDLVGSKLQASGEAAVPALRVMLRHEDAHVRSIAAQTARRIGEPARALVPLLIERLPLDPPGMRPALILALGSIGGEGATAAVPALRRAVDDPVTHAAAISALARITGPAAVDLAGELIVELGEQSQGMCPHPTADDDLRAIGPAAAPAVVAALSAENVPYLSLVKLLEEWGDEALAGAIPAFERWIEEDGPFALDGAERLQGLNRLDPEIAERVFGKALEAYNDWNRLRGAEGLSRLGGPSCTRAREVLIELRDHRYENLRDRAAAALERSCPH